MTQAVHRCGCRCVTSPCSTLHRSLLKLASVDSSGFAGGLAGKEAGELASGVAAVSLASADSAAGLASTNPLALAHGYDLSAVSAMNYAIPNSMNSAANMAAYFSHKSYPAPPLSFSSPAATAAANFLQPAMGFGLPDCHTSALWSGGPPPR